MTVIAYRQGVMAADSGSFNGPRVLPWSRKVARGPDGVLYGVTGESAPAERFLEWVLAGYQGEEPRAVRDEQGFSTFTVLVVGLDGVPRIRECDGEEVMTTAPYIAIGSASLAALGALYAGASAIEAVEAALQFEVSARGEIQSITREG